MRRRYPIGLKMNAWIGRHIFNHPIEWATEKVFPVDKNKKKDWAKIPLFADTGKDHPHMERCPDYNGDIKAAIELAFHMGMTLESMGYKDGHHEWQVGFSDYHVLDYCHYVNAAKNETLARAICKSAYDKTLKRNR